jgi:hypothetical protein
MPRKSKKRSRRRPQSRQAAYTYVYNGNASGTLAAQKVEVVEILNLNTILESLSTDGEMARVKRATMKFFLIGTTNPFFMKVLHVAFAAGGTFASGTESSANYVRSQLDDSINTSFEYRKLSETLTNSIAYVGNSAVVQYTNSGQVNIRRPCQLAAREAESVRVDEIEHTLAVIVNGTVAGNFSIDYAISIDYDLVARRSQMGV